VYDGFVDVFQLRRDDLGTLGNTGSEGIQLASQKTKLLTHALGNEKEILRSQTERCTFSLMAFRSVRSAFTSWVRLSKAALVRLLLSFLKEAFKEEKRRRKTITLIDTPLEGLVHLGKELLG